ncbi:MAG: ribosomal protein S18 acetylase RimI-like enzyme [Haloarculaceae archaeon]|jgi:ribosomal protein S18 acetylase RimI-like enzyme
MASDACDSWWHGDCEGTAGCPARCPRYLDRVGRAYVVRPLDEAHADVADVVAMYRDYPDKHRSMGVPPIAEPRVRSWLDRLADRGRNLVATRDGVIVGHAAYAPLDDAEPEMLVYVDPDYHGRGLGTELTKHVLAQAAEDGASAITLDVDQENTTAISVYEDLGFEPTDETPMEIEMQVSTDDRVVLHVRRPPAQRDLERPPPIGDQEPSDAAESHESG